jgi:malate permease and related proteins
MGLPVCLFAFGQEGFALGMGANVANALLGNTAGMAAFAGSFSIGFLSRNAYVYSALAATGFLVAGAVPPRWLSNTTLFLGAFSIPFLLFSLGASIARLTVADLPRAIAISAVRQIAALGIGWGLAGALGLQGAARGVLILQCVMPSMIINYILAQRYERQPEQVAGIVLVSTVISFLILPIVLLLVLPGAAP